MMADLRGRHGAGGPSCRPRKDWCGSHRSRRKGVIDDLVLTAICDSRRDAPRDRRMVLDRLSTTLL